MIEEKMRKTGLASAAYVVPRSLGRGNVGEDTRPLGRGRDQIWKPPEAARPDEYQQLNVNYANYARHELI